MCDAIGVDTLTDNSNRRSVIVRLLLVLLVALAARLVAVNNASMISRDGVTFIWYAQGLAEDPIDQMRSQDQHPLYPAMILAAHEAIDAIRGVTGGWLDDDVLRWHVAAGTVSLVGGLLVVMGVYALGAVVFDGRIGFIAALMAALAAELIQLSADALSDMPHLALYLFAMSAGIYGLRQARYRWIVAAGVLSGLAFLMRPEGAEAALVVAFAAFAWSSHLSWRKRLTAVACVGMTAAIVAAPYMMMTGKLVKKKSIDRFITTSDDAQAALGDGQPLASIDVGLHGRSAARIAQHWSRSLRIVYLIPAVIWLFVRKRMPYGAMEARTMMSAMLLHLAVLYLLILRFDYYHMFAMRHVMILTGLTLPFSAAGLIAMADIAHLPRKTTAAATIAVILFLPTVAWAFETRWQDDSGIRRAGEWIRVHADKSPRVMTTRIPAVFYADGEHVWCPPEDDAPWIMNLAREHDAKWLVFDDQWRTAAFFSDLERQPQPDETLTLAHAFDQGDRQIRVYRFQSSTE